MKNVKKFVSALLIIVLLLPLIPIPSVNQLNKFIENNSTEQEIDVEDYRAIRQIDVDVHLIEKEILELVNELREDLELPAVQSNDMLKAGAIVRAQETEETFSHTRPNGTDPFTVLNENGIEYNYRTVGENLAMSTYFLEDTEMAEFIFDGWVESEGHYETMINPTFNEIGVGVHYNGEVIYATQIFGRRR